MLELRQLQTAVVACHTSADDLDRLRVEATAAFRVASDEVLLLSAPVRAPAVIRAALGQLAATALVVVQTDAFAAWTLGGDDAPEAFSRLSALPLGSERPWMGQGLVAHVPAKILAANGGLHLLVPSTLGHHLRQRVLDACGDLEVVEAAPAPFEPAVALQPVA